MITTWTKSKDKLENNFSNIILVYCLKWTKKLALETLIKYENDYIYIKFQKKLASIANWPGDKINREYKKFVKWCERKFNLNDKDLHDIFVKIITLSIQIMLNEELSNDKCAKINFSPYLLNLQEFFYICIKNISKYYYTHPEKIFDAKIDKSISNNIIKKQITNYIPFKNIFTKIENIKNNQDGGDNNTTETVISNFSYNDEVVKKNKFLNNMDSDNDKLTFVQSISIDDNEIRMDKFSDDDDEKNIKHITLPKISGNNYKLYMNTNKKNTQNIQNINDPEEKFFSD